MFGVERCPLLGGSKYISYMVICPLYRGYPLFGGSVTQVHQRLTPVVLRFHVYTSTLRWSASDIVMLQLTARISVARAAASALYATLTNRWNVH